LPDPVGASITIRRFPPRIAAISGPRISSIGKFVGIHKD
jgi:hypothetical protein